MSEGGGLVAVTRQQLAEIFKEWGETHAYGLVEFLRLKGLVVVSRNELQKNAKTTCDIAWPCGVCDSQGVQNCRVKTKDEKWVRVSSLVKETTKP